MINFILGFILGIMVATTGFAGVAKILDNATGIIKHQTVELSK
jgi:hypothetical protein